MSQIQSRRVIVSGTGSRLPPWSARYWKNSAGLESGSQARSLAENLPNFGWGPAASRYSLVRPTEDHPRSDKPTMNNFGVIEVASTTTKTTPGWAYVPDTGPTPPAALQPINRKRAARNQPALSLPDLSAREETRLRKDLEALDRDSNRDVNIPIPPRPGGSNKGNYSLQHTRSRPVKINYSFPTF